MTRVVVVGAGAAGIAVAARLAARRHDVTVLEQSNRYGGKLFTLHEQGHAFDTGPSTFTLPAVYRDLFLKTGRPLEDEIDLRPVEPGNTYTFPDGSKAIVPGVGGAAVANALGDQLGGRAADQWKALIRRAGQMWQLTREPVLQSPLDGAASLARLARRPSDIRTIAPWKSLRSLGKDTFTDERLVMLLDRYATYAGSDPRKAPAVLATVPYVEQTFGIWHISGGLGALADAMATRAERVGVDFRFGQPVQQISVRDGRANGVITASGDRIDADVVISNVDAGVLYRELLADDVAGVRQQRARLRRATPSLSGFVILLGLTGRSPAVTHHNVSFPHNYDAEFDTIFGDGSGPVQDPAIYVCNPDDDLMRPPDGESWFILVNAPRHSAGGSEPGTMDWRAPGLAEQYRDHVLEVLARRGFDVRDRITLQRHYTPADLEAQTGSPGGSIYGTASHGSRSAFLRPANRSPIPGLFLVGGSAHPGGGLPLVAMSAEITADLVAGSDPNSACGQTG